MKDVILKYLRQAAFEGAVFVLGLVALIGLVGPWAGWESGYGLSTGYVFGWLIYTTLRAVWMARKGEK